MILVVAATTSLFAVDPPSPSPADERAAIRAALKEARFDDAKRLAVEHLDRVRDRHGESSPEFAMALDVMVEALLGEGRATEEEPLRLAGQALDLKSRLMPDDRLEMAVSLTNLGRVHLMRGDARAARQPLERALESRQSAAGPEDASLIPALSALGNVLLSLGDLEPAEIAYSREGALIAKHYGDASIEAAGNAYNRARLMIEMGDYQKAEALYEKAAEIVSALHGPDHPRMAWVLLGLGTVRTLLHDYAAALEDNERALAVATRSLPEGHPMIASCQTSVAFTLMKMNDLLKALEAFGKALGLSRAAYGPRHEATGRTLVSMAEAEQGLGRLEAAGTHLEEAAGIMNQSGSEYQKLECRLRLARLRLAKGDLDRGTKEINEARVHLADLLPGHPDAIDLEVEIGDLQLRANRPAEAAETFRAVMKQTEQTIGRRYPGYASAVAGLAEATARIGDPPEALALAVDAERLGIDRLRLMVSALPERQGLRMAEQRVSTVDLMLRLARSGNQAATAAAWDAVIRSRAVVLDELALRHRSISTAAPSPVAVEFAAASTKLANILVHGQGESPRSAFIERVEAAWTRRESAEAALARENQQFKRMIDDRDMGLARVSESLPPSSALVAFVLHKSEPDLSRKTDSRPAPDEYVALLTRAGSPPRLVTVGDARLVESLVAGWRAALRDGLGTGAAARETEYRRAAASLRERIWDPLEPLLGDARRIFIVPDGDLYLVSFATLPGTTEGYLVDSREFQYLSSERELVPSPAMARGKGLLAVGGPDFDAETTLASSRDRAPSRASKVVFRGNQATCQGLADRIFERLEGADREASSVARRWKAARGGLPGEEALELRGADATERRLKEAVRGRRVLHLATHGFFLDAACPAGSAVAGTRGIGGTATATAGTGDGRTSGNPLSISGLVLAGANHRAAARGDEEDGVLTAEEIATLDLSGAEWAVLSACDTGLGLIHPGEGVFGLRRAFHVAGAGTLIMSLWPVEDDSTLEWMNELYRARLEGGADTAAAVTQASRAALRRRRESGLSTHPVHWGAFVASGDWR